MKTEEAEVTTKTNTVTQKWPNQTLITKLEPNELAIVFHGYSSFPNETRLTVILHSDSTWFSQCLNQAADKLTGNTSFSMTLTCHPQTKVTDLSNSIKLMILKNDKLNDLINGAKTFTPTKENYDGKQIVNVDELFEKKKLFETFKISDTGDIIQMTPTASEKKPSGNTLSGLQHFTNLTRLIV